MRRPRRSTLFPPTTLFPSPTNTATATATNSSLSLSGLQALLESARLLNSSLSLRSEEHTSELQSRQYIVCRLLLVKKAEKRDVSGPALNADRPPAGAPAGA